MKKTWLDTTGRAAIEALQADITAVKAEVDREFSHRSYIFPDLSSDIDLTWAEITDSGATTLSSIAADHSLHISTLRIRTTSETNTLYVIEIGYGPNPDAVTVIDPHEFGSGDKKIDSDEQVRFRPPAIPQGQKAYYRMLTQGTLNATATIELRYHYE